MTIPGPGAGGTDASNLAASLGLDPSTLVTPPSTTTTKQTAAEKRAAQQVYWGPGQITDQPGDRSGALVGGRGNPTYSGDQFKTVGQAYQMAPLAMASNPALWGRIKEALLAAGVITINSTPDDIFNAWNDAVDASAAYTSLGQNISPFDYLSLYAQHNPGAPGQIGANGGTSTTTSTSVNASTDSASRIATQAQQEALSMLGTGLGADELNQLAQHVQSLEASNPSTQTTKTRTTTDKAGKSTTSSSNTTGQGAYDPTLDIQAAIRDQPTYAEYQAGVPYFNALQQAIQETARTG